MSPRNQSTLRASLYFLAMVTAVTAAFLYGYWQVKPAAGGDPFLRLMTVGKNYYDQGNTDRAIESFEKALAIEPASTDAQLNLANAYLLAGRSEDAARQAQAVAKAEPNSAAA